MASSSGIVKAAANGGPQLLIFSLSVASVVIVVLIGVLVWFVKDRVKARRRYEELLEKRLASGSATMQNLKLSVEQLQTKFIEHLGTMLKRSDFNDYRKEHNREHDRLDDKVADIRERYAELAQRVDAGIRSMSNMLSKLVKVNNPQASASTEDP